MRQYRHPFLWVTILIYIGIFLLLSLGPVHKWLLTNPEWTSVQGIVQNSGLITIPLAVLAWWNVTCHVPFCWRKGEHPVKGTAAKVCSRHHERQYHELVFWRHKEAYPERLGHGDSHDL